MWTVFLYFYYLLKGTFVKMTYFLLSRQGVRDSDPRMLALKNMLEKKKEGKDLNDLQRQIEDLRRLISRHTFF